MYIIVDVVWDFKLFKFGTYIKGPSFSGKYSQKESLTHRNFDTYQLLHLDSDQFDANVRGRGSHCWSKPTEKIKVQLGLEQIEAASTQSRAS